MKTTVYIATSVDGFIARNNGGIDWLPSGGDNDGGEDYGYQEFIDSVDALVMGRNTYELALSFDSWPYGEKPVFVLSSRKIDIPDEIAKTVEYMCAPPSEVVYRLSERGFQHLYIDGGKTIQGFLSEGLIQQLIITKVPILIGSGIPLFGSLPHDVRLHHLQTRQFKNGLVQSQYNVIEDAA
ncbi:dihydrofolate reductase (plasmid) [Synechocystis sp. PCC 7339]|uniref:dihydrofolate reductase family protein n=1 Tax=Synechocystis sp. PCC 7339 TaxID=2782213 RepID=UPI001CBF82C4|nr:dihydrofolate reductase family protein [Synechocystis sp. PCC 7339]UAJ74588.1 dihydrofolate reductase [Synechocystis sp. PCC 7339]